MNSHTCLLVDAEKKLVDWQEKVAAAALPMEVHYSTDIEEAILTLAAGQVAAMAVASQVFDEKLRSLYEAFQANVGALSDFQMVINDDPDPLFMNAVYEFGIEQFSSSETWCDELAALVGAVAEKLADHDSSEAKAFNLSQVIRTQDKEKIKEAQDALSDIASYDFRVAFAQGKANEASGNYEAAAQAFSSARSMNKMFRPSSVKLGETLMITGKYDEAIAIFEDLEKTNSRNLSRKASLASAYIEKGDLPKAKSYLQEAMKLDPSASKVLEVKAQFYLTTGKVNEALDIMDKMQEAGPFFAAKLNEMGIKLSLQGKGRSAITLYQKAHRIVREDLKYKISLNAALACRRLNRPDLALKYLERCETEFGGSFPKLEKIKSAVVAMMKGDKRGLEKAG